MAQPCLRCGSLTGHAVEQYSQVSARARIKRIKSSLKAALKFAEMTPGEYKSQTYVDGLKKALEIVMEERP